MPTTVSRFTNLLLTLAIVSAAGLTAAAQTSNQTTDSMQLQGAPIERSQTQQPQYTQQPAQAQRPRVKHSQPAQGVWLSVSPNGNVTTVAATPERTELRIDSGVANIMVHHPEHNSLILVDLGGGQVDVLKDGLYSFNAQTKTVRTLVGEAEVFNGTDANNGAKPLKVKESHAVTFGFPTLRSVDFQPFQAREDLLPRDSAYANNDGGAPAGYGYGGGYGQYGDGFYGGDPYFAYGYGYPYGVYPGFGFGYYGGFRGGYGGCFGGGYGGGFGGGRGGRR